MMEKKILIYDDKKLEDFVNFVDLMHTWNFKLLFNKIKTYATEQTGKLKISMQIYRSCNTVKWIDALDCYVTPSPLITDAEGFGVILPNGSNSWTVTCLPVL